MKLTVDFVLADFWDTAGQERFHSLHPSYYHQAHACIMVFDATRKVTYKNLSRWYDELRQYRSMIPCFCAANKIDGELIELCVGLQFVIKSLTLIIF